MPSATDAGARLITKNRTILTKIPWVNLKFPEFSRIKKFPEFSRLSRFSTVVSTLDNDAYNDDTDGDNDDNDFDNNDDDDDDYDDKVYCNTEAMKDAKYEYITFHR